MGVKELLFEALGEEEPLPEGVEVAELVCEWVCEALGEGVKVPDGEEDEERVGEAV